MSQGPIQVGVAPVANATSITTATTTHIKAGAGAVLGVVISKAQSGAAMTVYDGIDNTGKVLGIVDLNNFGSWQPPGPVPFGTGLTVVTTGLTTGSVTFFWR